MDNKFIGIISFSVIVEGIITYLNQFIIDGNFSLKMLTSIILGVVIAISYDLDIPLHFNLKPKIPFVGNIVTGILISRGSNYIFDLLKNINQ
ncbi:MAG: hypothetical protein ACI4PR_05835 [Acutalibacteraceae bacterium]